VSRNVRSLRPEYFEERERHWKVDRHIPVALIVTLVFQAATAIWWGAAIQAKVNELEKQTSATITQSDRLIKLETRFESVIEKLGEIRLAVDRIGRSQGAVSVKK